jgi:hypothetical protein
VQEKWEPNLSIKSGNGVEGACETIRQNH